jgi:hypothetical protein
MKIENATVIIPLEDFKKMFEANTYQSIIIVNKLIDPSKMEFSQIQVCSPHMDPPCICVEELADGRTIRKVLIPTEHLFTFYPTMQKLLEQAAHPVMIKAPK